MYVYFDWGVFNKIEKISILDRNEREVYSIIEQKIADGTIISPYSNAHINDLIRGYKKNPNYIEEHLNTLIKCSNNLCIAQYWGNETAKWHYREVNDFFQDVLDEKSYWGESIFDLFNGIIEDVAGELDDDFSSLVSIKDKYKMLLENIPLPDNVINNLFEYDPIFEKIYTKTKSQKTLLAFLDDFYVMMHKMNTDPSIYKSLRRLIIQSKSQFAKNPEILKMLNETSKTPQIEVKLEDMFDLYAPKNIPSKNKLFDKVIDTFCKIDLQGFKSDEKFSNLVDDALHCFYAAHCEYFVVIDDKCKYKAEKTYQKLSINSKVVTPLEFGLLLKT